MEALAAAMEPKKQSVGWCVGPTYDLCDKVFREIVILTAEHLRHRIITLKEHERKLVLRNLGGGISEIRGKTADNPVSLLGEGLDWLIADEAARMKPAIWESHLSQRLVDKRGWSLLISTPRGRGYFYDLFRRGQSEDPDFESWNHPSWTNPHLDRDLIEQERERLPERVFEQEFGGKFLEGAGSVFRYVRDRAIGEWRDHDPNEIYYGGLDLARVADWTVLTIVSGRGEVVFCDRFTRIDWSLQIERIRAALERYGRPSVLVDASGLGDPIYEALRHAGCNAEPYVLTSRSKSALVDRLAMLLERDELILPRPDLWPTGIEELESFEYSVSEVGNIKSAAPHGRHDDHVISLGLAVWKLRPGHDQPLVVWV